MKACRYFLISLSMIFALASCSSTAEPVSPSPDPSETVIESNSVFVSAMGSDSNSGLEKISPLLSLNKAIELALVSNCGRVYISGNLVETNTNFMDTVWC